MASAIKHLTSLQLKCLWFYHTGGSYELVSLLSTFFLTIQAIECMSFLAALSDFQQHLKKNKNDLTVEEVWYTNTNVILNYLQPQNTTSEAK